ncbi:MAG TPA: dTDP-4-dehydrorhamnose reductase [Chitinophagales bacterium]|nr:dTDP-4-dehydrorhamnose reductase [Chitinophagales bacterium]
MKVAVIGANGQLGTDVCEVFASKHEMVPLTHQEIEIGDIDNVKKVLGEIKPDAVICTAAAHNVPKCELEPDVAFKINGIGSLNLARVSNDLGFKIVQYSTDYVFDGRKQQPYIETDAVFPQSVYAITKYAGEQFILNYSTRHFVIRVSGIYGKIPCRAKGGNFISTMVKLSNEKPEVRVVKDEILTPTPTREIAKNTLSLIESEAYDLYHMTCEGEVSWYEFARTIFDTLQLKTPLFEASVKDFPLVVKRPFYSVLENHNLKKINLNQMPHWKDALINFLRENYAVAV